MVKKIVYSGTEFVTGDRIADALLDVVAALGSSESTTTVTVPAYDSDTQKESFVDIVIGPSSEMVAIPMISDDPELLNEAAVAALQSKARSLASPHPVPVETAPDSSAFDDADLPDA